MGAVNGLLVAWMGMPSIVVTLATMVIIRGVLTWATQGATVRFAAGQSQWFVVFRNALGKSLMIIVALLVFGFFGWMLRWMSAGRAVYAVGSDQEAARLAGIRPRRVVFSVFVLMGALTAIAAMLNAMQFITIYPSAGRDMELAVIAAVVVGGTAITGGRGTLAGTLIGDCSSLRQSARRLGYSHAQLQNVSARMVQAKAIQGSTHSAGSCDGWACAEAGMMSSLLQSPLPTIERIERPASPAPRSIGVLFDSFSRSS